MLTDAECRNAVCEPDKKRERMTDSGGLYLEVAPNGSQRWFWKFRKGKSDSRLALLIRPCEVLSRVANVTILEVANNALRVLLQHRHVIIGSLA